MIFFFFYSYKTLCDIVLLDKLSNNKRMLAYSYLKYKEQDKVQYVANLG